MTHKEYYNQIIKREDEDSKINVGAETAIFKSCLLQDIDIDEEDERVKRIELVKCDCEDVYIDAKEIEISQCNFDGIDTQFCSRNVDVRHSDARVLNIMLDGNAKTRFASSKVEIAKITGDGCNASAEIILKESKVSKLIIDNLQLKKVEKILDGETKLELNSCHILDSCFKFKVYDANFSNCSGKLNNFKIDDSRFYDSKFITIGMNSNFWGCRFDGGSLQLDKLVKFHNCKFENIEFSDSQFDATYFYNCEFRNCRFVGIETVGDFGTTMRSCKFEDCAFKDSESLKRGIMESADGSYDSNTYRITATTK